MPSIPISRAKTRRLGSGPRSRRRLIGARSCTQDTGRTEAAVATSAGGLHLPRERARARARARRPTEMGDAEVLQARMRQSRFDPANRPKKILSQVRCSLQPSERTHRPHQPC